VESLDEKLRFDGVSRRYGALFAVRDFSLTVCRGEILCLLGASGSGKTTVLRLAAGLERVTGGHIRIDGELVSGPGIHVPPERRGVGLMFQDFALFPHLTLGENVAFGLKHLAKPERLRRVGLALERVGLSAFRDRYPQRLSGGEQQRVALARALAPEPRILLMDEPFSGLDPALRDSVREETVALLRELRTTALLVTHDPEEAMTVADRIALMRGGRLAQLGLPHELYDSPVDREAAAFFSTVNVLHAFVQGGEALTALGAFDAKGFAEGTEVDVLLRPQALAVKPSGEGIAARIRSARSLGAETELLLEIERDVRPGALPVPLLKARLRGRSTPSTESRVFLEVARDAACVVPCAKKRAPAVNTSESIVAEHSASA